MISVEFAKNVRIGEELVLYKIPHVNSLKITTEKLDEKFLNYQAESINGADSDRETMFGCKRICFLQEECLLKGNPM
ncbi:hypothetical protein TNCT_690661 [Trichonephila clavata]|uniref:Uncharacterized protein n=1 Tax=Trichonephila clavata TaxID=2740835 RepID=A0A8X6HBX1_TRICU|nr:hypothetical protein TNCT_690661 [Trichonephila clavata]